MAEDYVTSQTNLKFIWKTAYTDANIPLNQIKQIIKEAHRKQKYLKEDNGRMFIFHIPFTMHQLRELGLGNTELRAEHMTHFP